jgi:hypothetical protein
LAKASEPSPSTIELVRSLLPEPVREEEYPLDLLVSEGTLTELALDSLGGFVLVGGNPGMVAVHLAARHLEVLNYRRRWVHPHRTAPDHERLAVVPWEALPTKEEARTDVIRSLVNAAVAIRQARFRVCRHCRESNPPEWQYSARMCHSCAEEYLGIQH